MDRILTELVEAHGAERVADVARRIPSGRKRMAQRNNMVRTMSTEKVLVFRMPAILRKDPIAA